MLARNVRSAFRWIPFEFCSADFDSREATRESKSLTACLEPFQFRINEGTVVTAPWDNRGRHVVHPADPSSSEPDIGAASHMEQVSDSGGAPHGARQEDSSIKGASSSDTHGAGEVPTGCVEATAPALHGEGRGMGASWISRGAAGGSQAEV